MKSPSPANKSTPKARVMHAVSHRGIVRTVHRDLKPAHVFSWETVSHCLVRPCASRKQADQLARFANLTWEEKVERVARAIFEEERFSFSKGPWNYLSGEALERYLRKGRAALAALGEQPDKGESEA